MKIATDYINIFGIEAFKRLPSERNGLFKKVVYLEGVSYIVEIGERALFIDDCFYPRRGKNIIEQISNAVLEHADWILNSEELTLLNQWNGIIN